MYIFVILEPPETIFSHVTLYDSPSLLTRSEVNITAYGTPVGNYEWVVTGNNGLY